MNWSNLFFSIYRGIFQNLISIIIQILNLAPSGKNLEGYSKILFLFRVGEKVSAIIQNCGIKGLVGYSKFDSYFEWGKSQVGFWINMYVLISMDTFCHDFFDLTIFIFLYNFFYIVILLYTYSNWAFCCIVIYLLFFGDLLPLDVVNFFL